jgi:flagellar hook protein FlgE
MSGVFGALFAGVSGLNGQSQRLSTIADNIANVGTTGYKRVETAFSTFVTQTTTTRHSAGGVRTSIANQISQQGLLESSLNKTDIAISGNGMFVVNETPTPGVGDEYLYTRAGQFKPDKNGNLVNTAGYYLQGWPLDQDGDLPTNNTSLVSLETINIAQITGQPKATSSVEMGINLPSSSTINATGEANDPRSVSATDFVVFDSLGQSQSLRVAWTKVANNQWHMTMSTDPTRGSIVDVRDVTGTNIGDLTSTSPYIFRTASATPLTSTTALPAGVTGESFSLTLTNATTGATTTVTVPALALGGTDDVSDLMATINAINPRVQMRINDDVTPNQLEFYTTDRNDSISGIDLSSAPDLSTFFGGTPSAISVGANKLSSAAKYSSDAAGGDYFDYLIFNFNADGTLKDIIDPSQPGDSTTTPAGRSLYNNNSQTLDIVMDFSASGADADQVVKFDFGRFNNTAVPNVAEGITQYDANLFTSFLNQDGVTFGSYTGVDIDSRGIVTAIFDNGQTQPLYQIPIVSFANTDGLAPRAGNAYSQTERAGEFILRQAGTASAGGIVSSSKEASTVDIAEEFSNMIVTQRSYSAATRVISTADQMLEELINQT